jgi:hypothetical protein
MKKVACILLTAPLSYVGKRGKSMRRKILAFSSITVLVMTLALLSTSGNVLASDPYLVDFNAVHGGTNNSLGTVYNCGVCHTTPTASSSARNLFGAAWRTANYPLPISTSPTLAAADSDTDGFTNAAELSAGTYPGNAASFPVVSDTQAPTVSSFTVPGTSSSLTVLITAFVATDNVAVTGFMVTESAAAPAASAAGWSATAPAAYTFATAGAKTLFAWAKDGANNVSTSISASTTVTVILSLFADVGPAYFAFNQIEAIATAGITGGCQQDNPLTPQNEALFCPDAALNRAQMAIFVETSLGVAADLLPPCAGTVFNDVTVAAVGEVACRLIEDFAASGISGGCQQDNPATPGVNEAMFCPNAPVTRAQMAVFIEAALGTPAVPACLGTVFSDVTAAGMGTAFCGFIEDFVAQGIAAGCQTDNPATTTVNEARYCPNDPVTRAQMAVFLVAAPAPLLP